MKADPRMKPVGTTGAAANANLGAGGLNQFTVDQLGMEVANELGIDPHRVGPSGLTAAKIDQVEAQTHSGTQNSNSQ